MQPIGVVLAGGRSRRMGRDKALMELGGESLVARAARCLAGVVGTVAVADRGRGYLPDLPSLDDGPGRGPAAGLLGAARAFPDRSLLVLACDLPAVPVGLLAQLVRLAEAEEALDAVFPRTSRGPEPLCALWGPRALALLGRRVTAGDLALHPVLADPKLRTRALETEELRAFGEPDEILRNLNSPEDLRSV